MRELVSDVLVSSPLAQVFPFFADAGNLELLTPPWLRFSIDTPRPIVMGVGTRIDYRIRLRGLPLRWQSEITAWEPPFRFVDEQRRGPYRAWRHEHTFEARAEGTLVRDRVCYLSRGGLCEPLLERFLVGPDLRRIFAYRAAQMRRRFGAGAEGGAEMSAHPGARHLDD